MSDRKMQAAAAMETATALDPTIEELAQKLGVKGWALEGVKKAYGWGQGKRLPEAEFREKMETWLSGPMHR